MKQRYFNKYIIPIAISIKPTTHAVTFMRSRCAFVLFRFMLFSSLFLLSHRNSEHIVDYKLLFYFELGLQVLLVFRILFHHNQLCLSYSVNQRLHYSPCWLLGVLWDQIPYTYLDTGGY